MHPHTLIPVLPVRCADKPVISITAPTAEEVSRYLPPDSGALAGGAGFSGSKPPRVESARQTATPPRVESAKQTVPPLPASSAADAAAEDQEAALVRRMQEGRGRQAYELARQQRQDEVDAGKRLAQVAAIGVFDGRLQDFNSLLRKPGSLSQNM